MPYTCSLSFSVFLHLIVCGTCQLSQLMFTLSDLNVCMHIFSAETGMHQCRISEHYNLHSCNPLLKPYRLKNGCYNVNIMLCLVAFCFCELTSVSFSAVFILKSCSSTNFISLLMVILST